MVYLHQKSTDTRSYCHPCPPGRYGNTFFLRDQGCTGPCAPGHYGDAPAMRTPECSGQCNPGYICPPGSRSSTERLCGSENFYCPTGSGVRLRVSKGYYTVGATLSARESQHKCEPGYYCKYGNKRPVRQAGMVT